MGKRKSNHDGNGFEQWGGYMEAKKSKLLEQFNAVQTNTEKVSDVFQGVAIFVNGYTNRGVDDLKLLMAAHGGIYHHYQCTTTTHIIASNLPNTKVKQLGAIPVVKPAWITDSIAREKLLDHKNYLLYTNQSRTQPRLHFPTVDRASEDVGSPRVAPAHNVIVADDDAHVREGQQVTNNVHAPSKRTLTAADPQFLHEFYANSRLHLISTLGAEFKQLVGELREKSNGVFPSRDRLTSSRSGEKYTYESPIIMHIDMDCFFVSVGLRSHPELRGQPVAVTHARNSTVTTRKSETFNRERTSIEERFPAKRSRVADLDTSSSMSEIASCSYEARKCGISNGMFLGAAIKLCPALRTIPYDFEGYREVSHALYNTLANYTLDIEAVSCDEMYVDVRPVLAHSGMTVEEWAKHIRNEITANTGCPCSTGFGANKLQARLATRKAKPNGQFHLKPLEVAEYVLEVPLADLPGVGYATVAKLNGIGVKTCGDLQMQSLNQLQTDFGRKMGESLYEQCRGVDKKPLNYHHERKSVSADVNYGIRFTTNEEALAFLRSLAGEVDTRLRDVKMLARCLTLKLLVRAAHAPQETAKFLGCGVCDSINKSVTSVSLGNAEAIFNEARKLFEKIRVPPHELRGVGIQLTRLEKQKATSNIMSKFLRGDAVKTKTPPLSQRQCKKETNESKTKNSPMSQPKLKEPANESKTIAVRNCDSTSHEVDMKILQELPEDVRNDVIKEYNLKVQPPPTKIQNPFNSLTWRDIKPMVLNWLKSTDSPLAVDVTMLVDYMRERAISRHIEELHVMLNYLHRNIEKNGGCAWHEAYGTIVNVVQEGMVARYGSTLCVNRRFNRCNKHN